MSSVREPEIEFAQRLACNEKAIRSKALKKLRKYVSVRSLKHTGGFTAEELLKLWKGLFYCLWMQDKPLLQEELSDHISTLMHSFQQFDTQLLYFESFLNTFKREWSGIDRLRMDKFFQLVRFMFRQMFEVLKRKDWESSAIEKFLQLLTAQLLQTSCEAPSGLQFHILDLYMTELASVGSAELTASQNLTFIEPFCKTAAKTKNPTLLSAICSSIFSVIIDQAPFAIDDLMKEMEAAEASDSDSSEQEFQVTKKGALNRINGTTSKEDESDSDSDEETDTEMSRDNIGPVLQFDYAAVADKLLKFAGRSSTPSPNRLRLYKIIKVLRDLSQGIFPQDVYPEEVSTDEDDDMFGSRKRMKRGNHMNGTNEEAPSAKKKKKKKELDKQNMDDEPSDPAACDERKKVDKKKGKRRADKKDETAVNVTELACSDEFTDEADQSTLLTVGKKPSNTKRDMSEPEFEQQQPPTVDLPLSSEAHDLVSEKKKKKKKKRKKTLIGESNKELLPKTGGVLDENNKAVPPITDAVTPAEKMNKDPEHGAKSSEMESDTHGSPVSCEPVEEITAALNETNHTTLAKKKKGPKAKGKLKNVAHVNGLSSVQDAKNDCPTTELEQITHAAPSNQESQKTCLKGDDDTEGQQTEPGVNNTEVVSDDLQQSPEVPNKKAPKRKGKQRVGKDQPIEDSIGEGVNCEPSLKKKKTVKEVAGKAAKKKKRKIPVVFEFEEPTAEINELTKEETTSNKTKLTNEDQTQSLASKKVTFGLKNNKTAEFRKTDRSLLVSPDGTSRVPFDPQQKPKCGVLKSPLSRLSMGNKKTRLKTSNSLLKKRPTASDFF